MSGRGGDKRASEVLTKSITETGGASLATVINNGDGTRVLASTDHYLYGMGLNSTISKR